MRFEVGDAVVYPVRGAGVIAGLKKFDMEGDEQQYYKIKLLKRVKTNLLLPIKIAEDSGLRLAISPAKLDQVWQVLGAPPQELPSNHRSRYKVLGDKMSSGDIFELTEAVRDMAWRRIQNDGFTPKGKRLYRKGLRLLAEEIAVSLDIDLAAAEERIRAKVRKVFPPSEAA